jgi:ABC-type uncharacterized transport system substrate-binding protein
MRLLPLIALCLTLLAATPASAHPHVFVTMQTEILYDAGGNVTGFKQKWAFDELYSSFAVQGMERDSSGQYSRATLQPLAEINVKSLSEFGYFTFPKLAGQKLDIQPPSDYWIDANSDGTLTLNFTSLLVKPVSAADVKTFSFAIYDPTVYVSFAYADIQPVKQSGGPAGCMPKVKAPQPSSSPSTLSEAYFGNLTSSSTYGAQFAQTVVIECKGQ